METNSPVSPGKDVHQVSRKGGNQLTSFTWEGCPQGLKEIDLDRNKLTEWSWKECPPSLVKVNVDGNQFTNFTWDGCPLNLEAGWFQKELKEYKESKEYMIRASRRTRDIADMITHINFAPPSCIHTFPPALKKYVFRGYYEALEDFKKNKK